MELFVICLFSFLAGLSVGLLLMVINARSISNKLHSCTKEINKFHPSIHRSKEKR